MENDNDKSEENFRKDTLSSSNIENKNIGIKFLYIKTTILYV